MSTVTTGQCGLCKHFGEHVSHDQSRQQQLVQIRTSKQAPDNYLDECGHPQHESLHLVVTPVSGCQGFEAATA